MFRDVLLQELKSHKNVRIVSFDIFDTLLFRTTRQPDDVFVMMYQARPELFPEYTDAEDWRNIRKLTEIKARDLKDARTSNREVTLKDIYELLPHVYQKTDQLFELELICEKKACFLNEEIYDIIKFIKYQLHMTVVLTSDMYLNSKELLDILAYNGFEPEIVDRIYVSCEYEKSKRTEGLYLKILEDYQIAPDGVFHIGDNIYSDSAVPIHLGIPSYHYKLISDAEYRFPFLKLENLIYGDVGKEIYSLRLLAAGEESDFWYQLGAMVFGPFLTYAAEWVVDTAEQYHIKNIRPLMREGKFLTEMIQEVINDRGKDISVKPLYISRLSAVSALFEQVTGNEINYIFQTYNMKLKDIFSLLKVEELESKYKEYMDNTVVSLREERISSQSVYEMVLKELCSDKIIAQIRNKNKGSVECFKKYLKQEAADKEVITVDIGWRGSIQNAINKVLAEQSDNASIRHLLYISKPETALNLNYNCDIRGFVGNFGSQNEHTAFAYARLFELFLGCEEGTTVTHKEQDGKIIPVLRTVKYPEWQMEAVKRVQKGIKSYQRHYLKLAKNKNHVREMEQKNMVSMFLAERLNRYPIKQEISELKELVYDQNFGVDVFQSILSSQEISDFMNADIKYHAHYHGNHISWIPGLNVWDSSLFYYKKQLFLKEKYELISILLLVEDALKRAQESDRKIILAGAGNNLPVFLTFFAAAGECDRIAGIIDNDRKKVGVRVHGIEIFSVQTAFDSNLYLITVKNKLFYDELQAQINSIRTGKMEYIGFYEKSCKDD